MGRVVVGRGKHQREIKRRQLADTESLPEQQRAAALEKVVTGGEVWEQGEIPESPIAPELRDALKELNPKEVAFFCAWVMNGRNITAASKAVGWRPQYGQRLFQVHPGIRAAVDWLHNIVLPEDQDWTLLLPEARRTIRSLLDARDEKVRFWAAKDIVDRAEGKPTARLDMTIRDERPSMSEGELQLLFSIMQTTRVSYAEAAGWIRTHPDEVAGWVTQHALLPGRDVSSLPVAGLPEKAGSEKAGKARRERGQLATPVELDAAEVVRRAELREKAARANRERAVRENQRRSGTSATAPPPARSSPASSVDAPLLAYTTTPP